MNNNIIYLNCEDDNYISDSRDKKYTDYKIEECVLIRTTDIFPFDKVIQTPVNGHAYGLGESTILGKFINNKIKQEMFSKNCFDVEKVIEEIRKYYVCFASQRTTIHFTINGLVSSHLYGDFEGRPYIIIEPLKYHLQDESLLSLRVEDTYFNNDMILSDEAVIIINEEKFNEIKNIPEYIKTLENFKIFVYKGKNEQEAVQKTLEELGFDSFILNSNGYLNTFEDNSAAEKMYQLITLLQQKYNINNQHHYNSEVQRQDNFNTEELGKQTDLEHFYYIINNATTLNEELKKKILKLMTEKNSNDEGLNNIMSEIIDAITLEEIQRLTKEFNQIFINNLNQEKNSKTK